MLRRTAHHMRHNVVAYLALFLALSGSAMAARPLIDSTDVQDESLTGADVKNDSLTGDDVLESTIGVPFRTVSGTAVTLRSGSRANDFVTCPSGERAISGGYRIEDGDPGDFHVVTFEENDTEWLVEAYNADHDGDGETITFRPQAVCVRR